MKSSGKQFVTILFLLVFPGNLSHSDVRLPGIFTDDMVLQRQMKVPVWGTAEPAEKVSVTINGNAKETITTQDGRWRILMSPMEAGGPYDMTVKGNNTLTFKNVLVGDVWVCSGQSNMGWPLSLAKNAEDKIGSMNHPTIRLFSVPLVTLTTPQTDFKDPKPSWALCDSTTAKNFSAIGYFFGRDLQEKINVPIGLINSSWGGTPAESWTPFQALQSDPILKPIVEDLDALTASYPQDKKRYDAMIAAYQKALKEGKPLPDYPQPLRAPGEGHYPSGLFNAMISPLIPYGIKGVIWYQGESNSIRAYQYRTLFPTMIREWRKAWRQGAFPFLFVQLASWDTCFYGGEKNWGSWPELREAQLMTLSLPKTGMAVTIDIGDSLDIHPPDKWDVGYRLMLSALHVAYGRDDVVYSGPIYSSIKVEDNTVRLTFENVGGGLVTKNNEPLIGFIIAGKNKIFHKANAHVEGNEIIVSNPDVQEPVAVRYAWDGYPHANLFNKDGLPASPFRTDDWKGVTDGRWKP